MYVYEYPLGGAFAGCKNAIFLKFSGQLSLIGLVYTHTVSHMRIIRSISETFFVSVQYSVQVYPTGRRLDFQIRKHLYAYVCQLCATSCKRLLRESGNLHLSLMATSLTHTHIGAADFSMHFICNFVTLQTSKLQLTADVSVAEIFLRWWLSLVALILM